MAEVKKLRGEDLQSMSWEEAKAWCEKQDREMFETAKQNGGYWTTARGLTSMQDVRFRVNEKEISLLWGAIKDMRAILIGFGIGYLVSKIIEAYL